MINGVTELTMMKADVMDTFDIIKVCTHYKINGKDTEILPFDVIDADITPVYVDMKGWKQNITLADNIPEALMNYISFIEKQTGVPISIVSVGPDRKQTIIMKQHA
jgi:adenylosuccinate synthase